MSVNLERWEFESLVRKALEELPPQFHGFLRGLQVRVDDYPSDELMQEWGLAPPDYPFGMYEGPALPEVEDREEFDGIMVLYQRPLETWSQDIQELRDQIRRTVYHEMGHRLGFPEEGMPDELRGGVGGRWGPAELWQEAQRHLRQAGHDLAAAEALHEAGVADWALDAALTTADRALRALLMAGEEDPDAFAQEDLGGLLARAIARDRAWRRFRTLARLHRVSTAMGAPTLPPPAERVGRKAAAQAVELAAALLEKSEQEVERWLSEPR